MDALPLQKSQNSMTELINLLDDIKKTPVDELDSAPSTDLAKTFLSRFDIIYADPSFRHSYSILSKNLGSYAPDERDSLPVWIARIDQMASMREENDTNKRISRSIEKLLDHIELECVRLNRMDEVKNFAKVAKEDQKEALQLVQTTQEETEQLNKKVKGFHEQSITILGIFSAVVVGFMAEFSLFSGGFDKLTPQNVYAVTFYCVMVGAIIFDTLFMLIFFVAKIAGFSLAVERREKVKGWWISRTFKNYPYVYIFNIFSIVAAVFLYIIGS